jgi:hypothetical protein
MSLSLDDLYQKILKLESRIDLCEEHYDKEQKNRDDLYDYHDDRIRSNESDIDAILCAIDEIKRK